MHSLESNVPKEKKSSKREEARAAAPMQEPSGKDLGKKYMRRGRDKLPAVPMSRKEKWLRVKEEPSSRKGGQTGIKIRPDCGGQARRRGRVGGGRWKHGVRGGHAPWRRERSPARKWWASEKKKFSAPNQRTNRGRASSVLNGDGLKVISHIRHLSLMWMGEEKVEE